MIDHVSLAVKNIPASAAFYDAILAPLGYHRIVDAPQSVAFGKRYPEIWLNQRANRSPTDENTGAHVCLRARSEDAVKAFHAAALAGGGKDDGGPGPRQAALTGYYAAFVLDLDGNKIEAATFPQTS
ncbi:MAG: VOC family protein [Alphaproteobacteria bacterium]|nr:VOC family protein [Alphaproteobacteria bacterium]